MDNFLFLPRALVSALFDISFAAALGTLLARLWLSPEASPLAESLRCILVKCAAAMLLLLAIQTWLLTASMIGSASFATVRAQLGEVLCSTHAGRVLIPQAALTLLLLLTAALRRIATKSRTLGVYAALTLIAALICARAASGHAAAQGDFALPELVQFFHLSSIAIWAGG